MIIQMPYNHIFSLKILMFCTVQPLFVVIQGNQWFKPIFQGKIHKNIFLTYSFPIPNTSKMISKNIFEINGGHFPRWPPLLSGGRFGMPPIFKMNYMMYINSVPSFMLLSKSARFRPKSTLSRWTKRDPVLKIDSLSILVA